MTAMFEVRCEHRELSGSSESDIIQARTARMLRKYVEGNRCGSQSSEAERIAADPNRLSSGGRGTVVSELT